MNWKNKSCVSCANLWVCNVTNIFQWDNIFSNNKIRNLITLKRKINICKHIMKLMPKMALQSHSLKGVSFWYFKFYMLERTIL